MVKNENFLLKTIFLDPTQEISREEILDILDISRNVSVLEIDITLLRKKLESFPLIDSAIVERRLPNIIHISIKENIPIAIWQYHKLMFLINQDGDVIENISLERYLHLIHVIGEGANTHANQLIQDLKMHKELFHSIFCASRQGKRRWDLYFRQDILVKMPAEDFIQAYDFIYELFKSNKLFDSKIKVLDLRDKKKYYIK